MIRIKFDADLIKFMSLFESVTRSKLKDLVPQENLLIFIVEPNEIGRAVGKGGSNVRRLEQYLKKRVKIVEFSPDKLQFIKNMIFPLVAYDIREEDGIVTITGPDMKTKGLLIGRNAHNLRQLENVIRRYFEVKEIKVV